MTKSSTGFHGCVPSWTADNARLLSSPWNWVQSWQMLMFFLVQPGASSINGAFGENGPILWRPGNFKPAKNPWSHNRLTNLVCTFVRRDLGAKLDDYCAHQFFLDIDQPVGAGFSLGEVTGAGSAETAQQCKSQKENNIQIHDKRNLYMRCQMKHF